MAGRLDRLLRQDPSAAVRVRGIRDRRVASAVSAVRLLNSEDYEQRDAGQLWGAWPRLSGEDPDAIIQLARQHNVKFCWQSFGGNGVYEGVFNPSWRPIQGLAERPLSFYRKYANAPSRRIGNSELGRALQDYLRQSLPVYMVPAAVMLWKPCH